MSDRIIQEFILGIGYEGEDLEEDLREFVKRITEDTNIKKQRPSIIENTVIKTIDFADKMNLDIGEMSE